MTTAGLAGRILDVRMQSPTEPIPKWGGMCIVSDVDGLSRCTRPSCGWQGVGLRDQAGVRSLCPHCDHRPHEEPGELVTLLRREPTRQPDAPARNAPCPCGSGKKSKKCCWP